MENVLSNNYTKGCVSGMFGIILSHPLDSIKTHNQTSKIRFTYNIKNLYSGIKSPLIGVGFEKAVVFGTYNYCKNNYQLNIPLSGAISGLVATSIVSPYERIKILQQTKQNITIKMLMSPLFIFKGITTTLTREVPGFAIYFSTYEMLKNKYYTSQNKQISIFGSFVFGGMSGSIAWIFIYPQDRIKTIIQSNTGNNITIKDIINTTYKNGGFLQFYKGFSFAIGRAILLHSGTFSMMEILTNLYN